MSKLEVVRAGAGSGKTTDLCKTVAEAVEQGCDPARILATTFTRKAAAELKGRIQTELLASDAPISQRQQRADRLELAAIGTVHSVAHQLLSRYAIEMGLSPRLEIITEVGSQQALGALLGGIPAGCWHALSAGADSLGIKDIHERILDLLAAKRGNRIDNGSFEKQMSASANRVCQLLAPTGAISEMPGVEHLLSLADRALADINRLNDTKKNTADAKRRLQQLKSHRVSDWGKCLEAARIKAGKRSGADAALDPLRDHATQVRRNAKLHRELREFSKLLTTETIRLDSRYEEFKSQRGLVDFTDLEILLLQLVTDQHLATRLAGDYDLILVDEFQDTNPLQLAIFQRIRSVAARSRWVGDPKQAIYGFRDTDPQLVDHVWQTLEAERKELHANYRSQAGLVQFVGRLFSPVFGNDAVQQPRRAARPQGVERWLIKARNLEKQSIALACGIADLHADGAAWGDIVILERTNRALVTTAAALDELGIPYLLESPGLMGTREASMLLAGLRLVADRSDALSAATILHILGDPAEETPGWVIERLKEVRDREHRVELAKQADPENPKAGPPHEDPWHHDPRFELLEAIDRSVASPSLLVQQVIEALHLPTHVHRWGDAARRCSHLDSFVRHTQEYEEVTGNSGQAATLTGLILYLEELASDEKDLRYPPLGHDAVTLMTYHSAKGLEWPVVVLSGLNSERSPDMWRPVVSNQDSYQQDPLRGRQVRSWLWPFGQTDGRYAGLRSGSQLNEDAIASPEGQRSSDEETAENIRLLYVGCTRAKHKLVFAHREGQSDWLDKLTEMDQLLDPSLKEGEYNLPKIDTTYVLRHFTADMAKARQVPSSARERWLSPPRAKVLASGEPRFHSPSRAEPLAGHRELVVENLKGRSYFPTGLEESQYSAMGDAVHHYLAALPSARSMDMEKRQVIAARCLAAFGVNGLIDAESLVEAGQRFCDWVVENFPDAQWHVEMPVTSVRLAGGHWNGTIDLALQCADGRVVLIDHKSAPIRRQHCEAKAQQYIGQLAAYREILTTASHEIASSWIHFPLAGVMVKGE